MMATSLVYMWTILMAIICTHVVYGAIKQPNPEPVIWDISPKLGYSSGLTAGNVPVILTISGYNFKTTPANMKIVLQQSTGATGVACPVLVDATHPYTDTLAYCTLPEGDGLPLFTMKVGTLTMRQLPRWYEDFYFWVWSEASTTNNPNCIQTPNSINPEPAHAWGDNWFCSAADKASLLMQWSQNGTIPGQVCINMNQIAEKARWEGLMYICINPLAPYQIQWSQTGVVSGKGCVPVREGSDPNWDDGLKQICGTLKKPYDGGAFQLYQYDPPRLTSITPNHGPTQGLTRVTIAGTSFGNSGPSITIGGKPCALVSYTHTQIICDSPSGQGATNGVAVTVNTQSQYATINYKYDPPAVVSVSPASAPTSGGATLIITGNNFGSTQGTAAVGSYYCPVVSWTDTVVKCTLQAGMGVQQSVVLTTYDGVDGNANVYFNFDKPSITSVVPAIGYYTQGGITITLNGASFGGTGIARVGGALCVTVTWAHTVITCLLPQGAGAQSPITVTTATQVNDNFYFIYFPPVITTMEPIIAASGTGVYLTIQGTSFGTSTNGMVTVGGVPCLSTAAQYLDQRILCALPSSGGGWHIPVLVTVAGQVSTSTVRNFTYVPTLTDVTFTTAPTAGGTPITLTGTSFAADARLTNVLVGGVNCPVTAAPSSTQVICTLPPGQGLSVSVVIRIEGVVNVKGYGVSYDPPTISQVSPSNGGTAGGYQITIKGTNFGTSASVTIGGADCPVVTTGGLRTQTQIVCLISAGSGQANPVVVTVPEKSQSNTQQSNSIGFNYNAPNITSIFPINGAIDGGITVTLYGTEFASAGFVTIGTTAVASTYISNTMATFVLPSGSGIVNVYIRIDAQNSNSKLFTYDGPSVLGVTPLLATSDAPGTILAVTGVSFGAGAKVYVGNVLCPAYAAGVQSSIRFDCSLQPGAGVMLPVVMKVQTQESPEKWYFNFTAPEITQPVIPSNGPTSGGTLITLTGNSFGLGGVVTIGGVECSQSASGASWAHKKIVCAVAVGQGINYAVRVVVTDPNGQPAQTNDITNAASVRYFSYQAPTITSMDPNPGATVGGGEIIVKGTNFGTLATVTFGGKVCSPSFAQSHVQYPCYLPQGQGKLIPVVVTVGVQFISSTIFNYAAPTVTSFTPITGPTVGGTIVTLTGTNFGDGTTHTMTFGGAAVTGTVVNTVTQTQITFVTPASTGINLAVTLTVGGQVATGVGISTTRFKYALPTITSVAGCTTSGVTTILCPVAGGTPLVITGSNFGTLTSTAAVTIGGVNCPVTGVTQTTVSCTLPAIAAGGFSLAVRVTINTQVVTQNYLSYAGPTLTAVSLTDLGGHSARRRLLAISTTGNLTLTQSAGTTVQMKGTFLSAEGSADASAITVRYGKSNVLLSGSAQFLDKQFVCGSVTVMTTGGVSTLSCVMATGTGRNLVFQVKVGAQYSAQGVDVVHYPRPEIKPLTIRLGVKDAPIGVSKVVGVNSEGDVVLFDVNFVGGAESVGLLSIAYGAVGAKKDRVCAPVTKDTYNGQEYLQCTTAPGLGSDLQFEVTANGQTSAPGTDLYSYVQSPVIYSVSGCPTNANNATFACPTPGGTLISIVGDNFGFLGLIVRIGTQACIGVTYIDSNHLTCTVPPGTGSPASVVVIYGQRFSRAVNSLSYAPATVDTISGCSVAVGVTRTTECPRLGGTILTLSGNNFGPASPAAIVVVGSQYCANVVHDAVTPHQKLTCTLPTGTDLTVAVLIRQGQGVLTAPPDITVSYVQCTIGRYAPSGVLTCTDCQPGTYSDDVGPASCKPCDSGTFINANAATVCSRCAQGTYSALATGATVGALSCTDCGIATYGVSDGASVCAPCVGGYYANKTRATTCVACAAGTHMKQSNGQTYCSACDTGRYVAVTAAYKDDCDACPSGRHASSLGASTCDLCDVGTISTGGASACTNCTAGHYIDITGQASCKSCAPGRYASLGGLSVCTSCQPGEYIPTTTDADSRFRAEPCPVGRYSVGIDSTECMECPQGTINAKTGQSVCSSCSAGFYRDSIVVVDAFVSCYSCQPGFYSAVANSDRCLACPIGKVTRQANATVCDQCTTGTVQPINGQSTCSVCEKGKFISSIGQGACLSCDAGKFAANNASSACDPCPLGTYSASGVTVCTTCAIGTYAGTTGLDACIKCGGGYYADKTGLSACTRCGVGTFANNEGYSQCTNCTAGYFSSSLGQFICLPCASGTVSQSSGQSTCASCSSGEYNPVTNADTCSLCMPGTYGASGGQAACRICNPGSFAANYSALECTPCAIGEYQPAERSTTCVKCPQGTYNAVTGQVACLPCPAGTFSNALGLTVCTSCDFGKYAEPPLNGGTINCTDAAAGKYVPTTGARQDINCPVGTYQPHTGTSQCIQCGPGEYNPLPAQIQCSQCEPGSANNAYGQASCPICDDGTKAPDYAMKRCDLCDVGHVAAKLLLGEFNAIEIGAQNCTACNPGYVAAIAGKARCDACPIGLYSTNYAASNCTRCADGHYNDKEAQSQCLPCPLGQKSTGCTTNQAALGGCIVCINCEIGSFRNETGGVECTVCPSGSYQPLTGQSNCTLCDVGKFGTGTGLTQCEECPYGQITSEPGMPTCSLCPKGTVSGQIGGSVCNNCSAGTYGDTEGATECKPCPFGYITATSGQTQCVQCPFGTYQGDTGQSVCKPCPAGQYGESLGADTCKACEPGSITNTTGLAICSKCSPGAFNGDFGRSYCSDCIAGFYTIDSGASECIACASGTYSAMNGTTECLPCERGKAQILTGASTCNNCTLGEYTGDTGQKKCKVCEVGKATDQFGSSQCASCNPGYFQPQERSTSCRICPVGQYSGDSASICEQCEPGTYTATNGSIACVNCASGYKQDKFGTSTCDACNAGEWSSGATKPTKCEQCAPNFISLTPGSPVCSACDVLAEASSSRTLCLCAIGYASIYKNNTNEQEADMTCIPCPDGAVCDKKGVVWLEMAAQVGWWKANQTFYRCLVKSHCTGGSNETDSMRCQTHRIGPLCAQVESGYTESIGGSVKACGNQGSSTATFVIASIAIFAAVVVQLVVLLRSGRHLLEIAERDERLKHKIQSGQLVDGEYEDEHELGLSANRFGKEITIHGPPAPKPDFTFKLKIALGFAQIISNLDVALEIQWPSAFKSFMSSLTPANIDFVQVSSIGCVVHTAFWQKLEVVIILPIGVCALLIVLFLIPGYIYYWRDTTSRKMVRRRFWKLLFYVLFLVYPYCSSTVLRTFVCKRIEGVDYLLADFSLRCYDDEWNKWAKIAGAMIVVYPLGIPAFFLFMLLRYRTRLAEVGVRAELGFLYDAYSRDLWWWELVDMLHKLIITSTIAFIPFEWQLASAMIVVCVYSAALYLFKPYVRKSDDRLHLVSLTEIIMLLMSGNVFNNNDYDALYDWLMSIILIGLVILFFIFFLLQAIQAVYKVVKDYRKSRKQLRDAKLRATGDDAVIDDSVAITSAVGASGKHAQTNSEWVDAYKSGVDVTAAINRTEMRRKATAAKRLTADDDDVTLTRNAAWAGHRGADGTQPATGAASSSSNVPSSTLLGGGGSTSSAPPTPIPGPSIPL